MRKSDHLGRGRSLHARLHSGRLQVLKASLHLKCLDLAHHLSRLSGLSLGLTLEVLVLLLEALHLLAKICGRIATAASTAFSLLSSLVISFVFGLIFILRKYSISVNASKMFVQILLAREAFAGVAFAIDVRTIELLSRTAVLVVNFAFMSQETTRISEAGELLTAFSWTLVGTIVFIHVLAPFTLSSEIPHFFLATLMSAYETSVRVLLNLTRRSGDGLRATRRRRVRLALGVVGQSDPAIRSALGGSLCMIGIVISRVRRAGIARLSSVHVVMRIGVFLLRHLGVEVAVLDVRRASIHPVDVIQGRIAEMLSLRHIDRVMRVESVSC